MRQVGGFHRLEVGGFHRGVNGGVDFELEVPQPWLNPMTLGILLIPVTGQFRKCKLKHWVILYCAEDN